MDLSSDATGLQYIWNRYYDARTGRFTQEDPIGLAGGMNLYGFAGGDPINFSDPFGLCPVTKEDPTPCTPGGVTWLKTTSASDLREFASALAEEFNIHVTVKSGDRNYVPKGGARNSAHLEGKAIDFHLFRENGAQLPDGDASVMIRSSRAQQNNGVRVIWHQEGTKTAGPHIHTDLRTSVGDRTETGGNYIPFPKP